MYQEQTLSSSQLVAFLKVAKATVVQNATGISAPTLRKIRRGAYHQVRLETKIILTDYINSVFDGTAE